MLLLFTLLAKDFKEVKLLQTAAAGVPLHPAPRSPTPVRLSLPVLMSLCLPHSRPCSRSRSLRVCTSILFGRKHVGAGPMYRAPPLPSPPTPPRKCYIDIWLQFRPVQNIMIYAAYVFAYERAHVCVCVCVPCNRCSIFGLSSGNNNSNGAEKRAMNFFAACCCGRRSRISCVKLVK